MGIQDFIFTGSLVPVSAACSARPIFPHRERVIFAYRRLLIIAYAMPNLVCALTMRFRSICVFTDLIICVIFLTIVNFLASKF